MDSPRSDQFGPAEEMARLRSLLVGPDLDRLDQVERRLQDLGVSAERVAEVLPTAVTRRIRSDDRLSRSLAPTIERTLELSIENNPEKMAGALSPVMMPAIRKSIAQQMKAMVQTLNRSLEIGLSWRGLKWRLEALRTGRPFAEVVLLRSLVFRVEQVFLVHRETALLLAHGGMKNGAFDNADLVASMMGAIQDFVRDSFGNERDEKALSTIEFGEHTIWIERAPRLVLAAVIRGNAPVEFRTTLQETLDELQRVHRIDLEEFSGDTAPFEASAPSLAGCCRHATRERTDRRFSPILGMVLIAVLAGIAFWVVSYWTDRARESELLRLLDLEPGVVVIRSERTSDGLHITGIRDPLASDPLQLVEIVRLDPNHVHMHFSPYRSLDASLLEKKLAELLEVPDGVEVDYDPSGFLIAKGSASHEWVESAGARALSLVGLPLDTSRVQLPERSSLEEVIAKLVAQPIPLLPGIRESLRLRDTGLVAPLLELESALEQENLTARVEVRLHWLTPPRADEGGETSAAWTALLREKVAESIGDPQRYQFVEGAPIDTVEPALRAGLPRAARGALIFDVRVRR